VYGDFIGERHHSQVAAAQLTDPGPKPMSPHPAKPDSPFNTKLTDGEAM